MQRQSNQNTALALTALIMTVGTSVHAQFQFLTDQPLNASDTARRNSRNEEGDAPRRPAARGYAAPEPEKKGFFGRLFSRDAEPARSQPQPGYYDRRETTAPPVAYAQPGTTYVRDGVRFSDPAGYNQSPAAAAPQAYDPPTGNTRPLQTHVVSDGVRYAPGAEPAVNYSIPAAPRTEAGGGRRAVTFDSFSGQRPVRSESIAPAAAQDFPVAQPQGFQPQWPQAQVVAPQYPPQDYAPPGWPNASDPRVIGAQAVATGETAVVPPSGTPRPLTSHVVSEGVRYAPGVVPDGYPAPAPRYQPPARNGPLDRPGFFSRLFGRGSGEPAPARVYPPAADAADSRRIYDDPTMRPLPAQNHPVQPAPEFNQRSRSSAPQPPAGGPQQDPFSGQRPTRRSNEYVPEVPQSFPQTLAPRSSLDAPPFAPSAPLPGNLSPAEERMFQPGVKPEDRRYLMYLYAKTGRADMAEPLAQEILARDPANKEALLAMSSLFVDKKDVGRSLAYATQLYQSHPDSNDALYYYGAANQLAGNYDEAAGVLRFLRLEKFAGRPFPYQLDLAGASEKTGNWRGQMTAYQELLDQNQVDDQTRVMVRRVLEPMQREHGDHVSAQGTAYLLKSGDLWQERVGGRTQVSDRDQLYVDAAREDVLVRSSTLLKRRWADDTEGWLGWQANWSRRWISDLWAGAYQDGALGGARLTHRLPANGAVWLEGFANERARDGLLLNSLDGRQHRLTLAGNYLIAERFQTYGALTGREVMVNGTELAAGLQGSWGVEFLARRESPEFKLGYRGTYDANSRRTGNLALVAPAAGPGTTAAQQAQVLDSLVLHWLHREGVYADLRDRLWGPFFYHLQGSADYAFERDSPEFGGRAGLVFQPRKSLEFDTEVAYSTSAATTDGGSDAWELGVSMKWWF